MADSVSEQFDSAVQQRHTVTIGMWAFLLNEVLFFGALITVYLVNRFSYPAEFAAGSEEMDTLLGTINTLVLISSSLTVVLAVHSTEHRQRGRTVIWLLLTIALGMIFLGIKAVEYTHHIEAGIPASGGARVFTALYFILTGMHALHMVIGMVVFTVLILWKGRTDRSIEVSGLYWHFVDVVWIFLFPMFYLVRSHVP